MKTLLDINLSVLNEFDDWKNSNPDWNIGDYLHLNYNLNSAISFSKLFFPDFIEKEGCVILNFRYDEDIFWQWHRHFDGSIKDIEYKCNFYEVMDFFNFDIKEYESDKKYQLAIDEFAKALKKKLGD